MQKAGKIIAIKFPCITVIHGCEHGTNLLFCDMYTDIEEYKALANLTRNVRNIFGSTRNVTTSMFCIQCKKHDKGVAVGLLETSECRYVAQ